MTDKEKKSKIADIIMDAIEEYNINEINRPMIASVYAGDILSLIDSKEPVSDDLEEASLLYYPKMSRISEPHGIIPADYESHYLGDANEDNRNAFKAGARWKEQTMEESLVLYKRAFDFYGMTKNSGFLMEECGELMSAVNKLQRNRTNKEAVIEELADVYQVLMAFVMHFGYDKFSLMLDQKKKRLEERLHKRKC